MEVNRIENVTPQQIADGLRDRRERWRAGREMTSPKPMHGDERDGGVSGGKDESTGSLTPYVHRADTEPDLDCIYENDASATLISMGFSSSFNPLGPDYGDQATVIFRDKGS